MATQPLSIDQFAEAIKSKYPGTYDHLDNQELSNRILAKYPQYRTQVDLRSIPQGPEKPGFWKSIGQDIKGMVPSLQSDAVSSNANLPPPRLAGALQSIKDKQEASAEDTYRKQAGYSPIYRSIAPIAEGIGVNVPGMEKSASEGDAAGVIGHAATVPAIMAATEGLRTPMAAKIGRSGIELGKGIGNIADVATFDRIGKAAKAVTSTGKNLGKIWASEPKPPIAQEPTFLERAISDSAANAANEPFPDRVGAHLENAMKPNIAGDASLDFPRYPGAPLPAKPAPELLQSRAIAEGGKPTPEPQSAGLGKLPVHAEEASPAIAKAPEPKEIERQLNDALGGKPLIANVPLKQQGSRITSAAPNPAEGMRPVDSTAIKSYRYDPARREFEVVTQNGSHVIHGDVSPEQAKAFENASSKGKAWSELKKNSTYVGKVVNGQRVYAQPPKSIRSADPNDLTEILQKSVEQAKKKPTIQ
jgi:hypothetical protein